MEPVLVRIQLVEDIRNVISVFRAIKCIRERALVGIIVELNYHVVPSGPSTTIIAVRLMKHVMNLC